MLLLIHVHLWVIWEEEHGIMPRQRTSVVLTRFNTWTCSRQLLSVSRQWALSVCSVWCTRELPGMHRETWLGTQLHIAWSMKVWHDWDSVLCLSTSLLQSLSDFLCLKHTDVNRKTDKSPVVCCAGMAHVVQQQQDPGELSPIADHRSRSSLWRLTRSVGGRLVQNVHFSFKNIMSCNWKSYSNYRLKLFFIYLFFYQKIFTVLTEKWCRAAAFSQFRKYFDDQLFVSLYVLELLKCEDLVLKLVIYEINEIPFDLGLLVR